MKRVHSFTMTQVVEDEKEVQKFLPKKSCFFCIHFKVCYWFRAEQQLLVIPDNLNSTEKQLMEQMLPFNAEQVAEICKHYNRAT